MLDSNKVGLSEGELMKPHFDAGEKMNKELRQSVTHIIHSGPSARRIHPRGGFVKTAMVRRLCDHARFLWASSPGRTGSHRLRAHLCATRTAEARLREFHGYAESG